MRKRNRKSRRRRQSGNQTQGRKAFNVERLEARRMMAGDLPEHIQEAYEYYTEDECRENNDCNELVWAMGHDVSDATATAYKTLDNAGVDPSDDNYVNWFDAITETEQEDQAFMGGLNEGMDTTEKAKAVAEGSDDSEGWHTGFLGIPYYNVEATTSGGENDGDGEQEDGGVGDEDDKLTWASWLPWADDDDDSDSQGEGESGDGKGSGEGDDEEEDGITWASWLPWADDDEDDDDDDDDDEEDDEGDQEEEDEEDDNEEGDSQSRPTEDSRDSDPRRGNSGPDPRQGGDGRPGGGSKTDPTPYRGAIVQGGNSDPSDPDSGRSGPGVGPQHPSYGAIDYGPDGKPVSHQGYLPPKDWVVQGGDSDPPKNSEQLAVDAMFSDFGAEQTGAVIEATVAKATGHKSVDLGGNLPTF